jgi:nucleoside triphosphate diphosphatase
MDVLRSPRGCPWDRKQTAATLRPFLLEETYEAIDAIDRGDMAELEGELGDVVFQCVFQAQIAFESGHFEIADSINHIVAKLIRRHPHVFTPAGAPLSKRGRKGKVRTSEAVLEQWEQVKAREQAAAGKEQRLLSGVPRALPALSRAYEIGTRVAAVGFEWPNAEDVMDKIDEEARELREALQESPARAAEELGDLLFSIANLSRKLGLDPESALREANNKFTERFGGVEDALKNENKSVHSATLEEMEAVWRRVKNEAALSPANEDRRAARPRSPQTKPSHSPSTRARTGRPSRQRPRRPRPF